MVLPWKVIDAAPSKKPKVLAHALPKELLWKILEYWRCDRDAPY